MRLIVPSVRQGLGAGLGSGCAAYDEAGSCTAWTSDTADSSVGSPIFSSSGGPIPDSVVSYDPTAGGITSTPGFYGSIGSDATNYGVPPGGSINIAQLVGSLSTAAKAAVQTLNATRSPGLIAGTQLVYNPQTGQVLNQAGTTIGATGAAAAQVASALSPTLITVLAIGAIAVFALMGNRR